MLEGKAIEPDLYFCIDKIRWSAHRLAPGPFRSHFLLILLASTLFNLACQPFARISSHCHHLIQVREDAAPVTMSRSEALRGNAHAAALRR